LVLLAGPLFDAVSASLFVFVVFSQRHSWLSLSPALNTFCQAALFTYLPRLLWQCYFFVRTDFYYVFVTLFNCKNLMQDTERFLVNQITRFIPISHQQDPSRIPAHEMSIIRLYSLLWIVGRLVALYTLFFLSLPILWGYCVNIFHVLAGRSAFDHLSPLDLVGWIVIALITMAIQISGLLLWLRSLFSKTEVK
ncbi:MAG: hypothetical protein JO125_03120, partial [Chloroflexi bacterium]|nr:hypothetical protein [Chloroflexota bacterium]